MARPPVIFHRVDDIGEDSSNDVALIECFEQFGIPYILSIVPMQLRPAMASRIKQWRHCEVFQHGHSHRNNVGIGYPDEFPTTYGPSAIRASLKEGRFRLEDQLGCAVLGYTPPWNRTSQTAIVMLEELGFRYLSGHCRYEYFTLMHKLNVSIDPILRRKPVTLRPVNELTGELQRQFSLKREIGIVYHPKEFPDSYLSEMTAFIQSVKPLSTGQVYGK
jgi:hypothetical protein